MESGVQSCRGHRTRTIKTDRKVCEWKVGLRVAGDTEPGQLRQTEMFANGKWGSELQGTQNQDN